MTKKTTTTEAALGTESGLKQRVYARLISEMNYGIVLESGVTEPLQ